MKVACLCFGILIISLFESNPSFAAFMPCNSVQDQNLPANLTCVTSKGFFWMRVKTSTWVGWKDINPDGRLWSDAWNGKINHFQAVKFCERPSMFRKLGSKRFQDARLPEMKEFQTAESHGIRELFLEMGKKWYWSNTPVPWAPEMRYEYNGYEGKATYYAFRTDRYKFDTAKCVAK